MARINLALRWVDQEDRHHAYLLQDLLGEYYGTVTSLPPTRSFTVGVIEKEYNDETDQSCAQVILRVMPVDAWPDFSAWCRKHGVDVFVCKKHIDGSKVWWPTMIEITAGVHNERLFRTKLAYT